MVKTVDGTEVPLEEDFGAQAQRAAEDHITACWEHFHASDEGGASIDEDPAVGAFDGCQTCEVREILFAATPFLEAGILRSVARGERSDD